MGHSVSPSTFPLIIIVFSLATYHPSLVLNPGVFERAGGEKLVENKKYIYIVEVRVRRNSNHVPLGFKPVKFYNKLQISWKEEDM